MSYGGRKKKKNVAKRLKTDVANGNEETESHLEVVVKILEVGSIRGKFVTIFLNVFFFLHRMRNKSRYTKHE